MLLFHLKPHEFYQKENLPIPTLSVVEENEKGISGMASH